MKKTLLILSLLLLFAGGVAGEEVDQSVRTEMLYEACLHYEKYLNGGKKKELLNQQAILCVGTITGFTEGQWMAISKLWGSGEFINTPYVNESICVSDKDAYPDVLALSIVKLIKDNPEYRMKRIGEVLQITSEQICDQTFSDVLKKEESK